jgi:Zn-dependent protease
MAAYAYLFTWQFAVIIMVSLFFHELGHIWAMKRCGLKTKGIYFIPFLGAAAVSEEMFKSRRDEVYVAIMGPIWGFGLAVATALMYVFTGNALFAAAAGWMALVNLFNLLPVNPLDGGRIMTSIAFSINSKMGFIFLVIGIIITTVLTFWAGMILFVFLLFIGSLELFFEYREYEVRPSMTHRGSAISAVAYIAIIAALWALMSYTSHIPEVDIAMRFFMS